MTVAELIERLKELPPEAEVWIESTGGEYRPSPLGSVRAPGEEYTTMRDKVVLDSYDS